MVLKSNEVLTYIAIKNDGDWNAIYNEILEKKNYDAVEVRETLNNMKCKVVTILDPEFPKSFNGVSRQPFALFYYGDISLLSQYEHNVAVVGSRECSPYGEKMTAKLVREICHEYNIVSGLAYGIDTVAHKTCLENGGKTIAVLGSGIDYPYPVRNRELYNIIKEKGLIISEYPGSILPKPENFPFRNRIIAAISKGLLVGEAHPHSGSSTTAFFSAMLGRDVFCVPYHADENSECNRLIIDGAVMVENGEDIIDCLNPFQKQKNLK